MKQLSLNSLVVQINDLFAMSMHHQDQAVICAAQCGDKLNQAKSLRKHGEWIPWIEENCAIGRTQASKYMRLAVEMPELLNSNGDPGHHLPGIKTALALLTAPDVVKDKAQAELEAGQKVTEADVKKWKAEAEKRSEENDVLLGEVDELKSGQEGLQNLLALANRTEKRLRENIALEVNKALVDEMSSHNLKLESLESEKNELQSSLSQHQKDQAKAIDKGVKSAIQHQQFEIDKKEGQLQALEGRIEVLKKTKAALDKAVGNLQAHQDAQKKIHDAIEKIAIEWHNVAMEGGPPQESLSDWKKVLSNLEDGVLAIRQYIGEEKNTPISTGDLQ